jgi:hypothetical protein
VGEDLAVDALEHTLPSPTDLPDHGDVRDDLLDLLVRGADRGQVRPAAVTQLVAEAGPALVMQRFLAEGPPVPDDYVVSVLDEVVMPLLRP